MEGLRLHKLVRPLRGPSHFRLQRYDVLLDLVPLIDCKITEENTPRLPTDECEGGEQKGAMKGGRPAKLRCSRANKAHVIESRLPPVKDLPSPFG